MLERLFTSKTRVRILEHLFFYKKETHLREISNDLGLSPSGIKRELDNLSSLGLIERKGNKISLNEKNPLFENLRGIFLKTDSLIFPLKDAVSEKKIKFAAVFGSFAQEKYGLESDVDLLIVGELNLSEVYRLLKPVEKKIMRSINPVVWSEKELRNKSGTGFVKDILSKKIIIVKGDENEFRKIAKGR